ncbi:MAG: DUF4476 domain-containing protein [Chitinophagaceae bacterium]|nr:DUF4476 domain-containing protein [Chitinophagaceae bacterium]
MALPENNSKSIKTVPREDISPFTEILAKAANDPSLKERPVAVKMDDKPVIVQNAVLNEEVRPIEKSSRENTVRDIVQKKKDSMDGSNIEAVAKNVAPLPVKREQQLVIEIIEPLISKLEPVVKGAEKSIAEVSTEYKRSLVTKRSESSTSEGFGLVYIDEYADGKKDTIRIIIPNPVVRPEDTKGLARDDKKFLDISSEDSVASSKFETGAEKSGTLAVTNINCKAFASEEDMSKLQKKMMAKKEEEDMVEEARKVFKGKCFSTEQVKGLSALFSKDVNKYKFFDAVYAYVSDAENFPPLSAELKDEYYIKRFKAMLR